MISGRQPARNIVQRQQDAAPELDDDRLLGLGQDGAPRLAGFHRGIGRAAPGVPLGHRRGVQPIAGSQSAAGFFRPLEFGSNARHRSGCAVRTARHKAFSPSRVIGAPRFCGTAHLVGGRAALLNG